MKKDLLLQSFEKMKIDSGSSFEIKGGMKIASECYTVTSHTETAYQIDYTDCSKQQGTDKTTAGVLIDTLTVAP